MDGEAGVVQKCGISDKKNAEAKALPGVDLFQEVAVFLAFCGRCNTQVELVWAAVIA